jgi:hypothetical protein
MSNDKKASLDILAEAHLPADLFTATLGSNYGMDGYPDMEYGMGVLDAVLDQDAQDAPALPSGVQRGAAAEMDLGGMMQEESLADLNWLDPTKAPDLDRLPESPEMIPELVDAWGVHRRTDGVHTAHQIDLAHARASEQAPKRKASARTIEKVVTHAMRRSIEGQHIGRIVREAAESMGEEMGRVVPLLRRVAADHGLAGNVFVRASAYPGWGTGKWKDHVKRHAKQARYLIVSSEDLKQATWIQNGRCAYTGKLAVTKVPWKQAHAHYAPRLEATGRKVASGDLSEVLRAAFLSQPRKVEADTGYLPTHETPDQRVSRSDARRQFASLRADKKVINRTDREMARRQKKAAGYLSQLVGKGLIQTSDRDRLMASGKSPEDTVRAAIRLASASRNQTYEKPVFSRVAATSKKSRSVLAGQIKQATSWVRKTMTEGFAGKDLDSLIHNRFAGALLEAAESEITQIRAAHEGLSGFLYVDSEVYASEAGAKGCESGAMKHRANQIPNVRAMDRCATCTLARVREDGTRKCGVYNKTLVAASDVEGPELDTIKQANINAKNMTDAEATASLFAPTYDPGEFNLVNASLEGFDLDPMPENEKVAEVAFGGWVID